MRGSYELVGLVNAEILHKSWCVSLWRRFMKSVAFGTDFWPQGNPELPSNIHCHIHDGNRLPGGSSQAMNACTWIQVRSILGGPRSQRLALAWGPPNSLAELGLSFTKPTNFNSCFLASVLDSGSGLHHGLMPSLLDPAPSSLNPSNIPPIQFFHIQFYLAACFSDSPDKHKMHTPLCA